MAEFAQVDVKEIKSDVPRSDFSEELIEQLADEILECKGILRPLVLKQENLESFVVLDGHLEYYAAVRAREKNPRQAEMVNAFVVSQKEEETVRKQIQTLNELDSSGVETEKILLPNDTSGDRASTKKPSDWITSFEKG